MKKVTIYDVAKKANCSTATVSLVLNGSDKIKAETKEKIFQIMKELDYSPNFLAQSLSNKSSRSLGLIIPGTENPIFSQMISGVEECVNNNGYNLILGISNQDRQKEEEYLEMLQHQRMDGMIIFPTFLDNILEVLSKKRISLPVVLCGSSGSNMDIDYVKCNSYMGAKIAVEHLIDLGKKHIAFITAVSTRQQVSSRFNGYCDALKEHNISYDEKNVVYTMSNNRNINDEVYDSTIEFLKNNTVDAIYCSFDYIAISVMRAVITMGYRIPEDIAIIGYDNINISKYLPIPLSTIDTHGYKVGYMATQILLDKIQNPERPVERIELTPQLVVRESTVNTKNI